MSERLTREELTKLQALPIPRASSRNVRFEDWDEIENDAYVRQFVPSSMQRVFVISATVLPDMIRLPSSFPPFRSMRQ